jgi:5-methylcytosine-specific restriction protein A
VRGRKLTERNRGFLTLHPLCELCAADDRVTAATECDHKIALADGGVDDESNLQGLCHGCHVVKTTAERARREQHNTGGAI